MSLRFQSSTELATELGERLRRIRIAQQWTQADLAARAGVSERAIRALENGQGSKVETLLSVIRALDRTDALNALAPVASVDPIAMLRRSESVPQRVRPKRKE
jgi:transcriptional regulator with XRE-family HTH domain